MSERDKSTQPPTSPYDEPTGQIEVPTASGTPSAEPTGTAVPRRTPQPDRDDFYERHARRSPSQMSRVDDLDDLGPDEVETRRVRPQPDADPSEPTAVIERPPVVPRQPSGPDPTVPATGATAGVTAGSAAATERFAADDPDGTRATDPVGVRRPAPPTEPAEPLDTEADRSEPDRVDTAHFASVHHEDEIRGTGDGEAIDDRDVPAVVAAEDLQEAKAKARRGTLDLGLLLLRVAVGAIALGHGLQKLFGLWNGPRLSGFEDMLVNAPNPDIGFNADLAKPLAILGAVSETVGGAMVILGLLTPVGASAILGTMLVAATFKVTTAGGFAFFATDGGVEYELMLAVAAAVIILTGPGLYSLDFPYGWARRPFLGSFLWLIVGIAAAVLIWVLCNGTNPLNSPGNPGS